MSASYNPQTNVKTRFSCYKSNGGFEFLVILPYDPCNYHERMSEGVKKNKSCSCCPYGFHIDVDFLNSLERNRKCLAARNSLNNVGKHFQNSKDHVQETQTQNLRELMSCLCKYLDKIIVKPDNNVKSKCLGLQMSGPNTNQPQTVPRTLHRQNLIKPCRLTTLSSRSFSEDENPIKQLRKSSNVVTRNLAFPADDWKTSATEELLQIKSQVENILSRLQVMETKEELISGLKQKIKVMNSERECLLMKLCKRCKYIAEGSQLHNNDSELEEQRRVSRSQSMKTCRLPSNQKSKLSSGALFCSKLETSVEDHQQTNGHSRKDETDVSKSASKVHFTSNAHRPRSAFVKLNPKTPMKAAEPPRTNVLQTSKTAPPDPPQKQTTRPVKCTSKIPFVRDKSILRNKTIQKMTADDEANELPIPIVTRSNSLDESGCRVNAFNHSLDGDYDDDSLKFYDAIVNGRKKQMKISRRSLSLVGAGDQQKLERVLMSSSDEDVGGLNSDCTDDQSSTSFDEGAYDGELGRIIYKQKLED